MTENTLEVTEQSAVADFSTLEDVVNQTLGQGFKVKPIENGISSGFEILDKEIGGLQNGNLTTIIVKPGMGKTALLLSIATNLALKKDHSIAIFSAERSKERIAKRIIESETGMSLNNIQNGKFKAEDKEHINTLINTIAKSNIFINDSTELTHFELCQKAINLKQLNDVKLIIVDYLELISTVSNETMPIEEKFRIIVESLKELARDLNIPVLLFSQQQLYSGIISEVKPDFNDIPQYLNELSDVVLFLHRCDLYNKPVVGNSKGKPVEIIVAKNKEVSPNKTLTIRYIESIAKFTDN